MSKGFSTVFKHAAEHPWWTCTQKCISWHSTEHYNVDLLREFRQLTVQERRYLFCDLWEIFPFWSSVGVQLKPEPKSVLFHSERLNNIFKQFPDRMRPETTAEKRRRNNWTFNAIQTLLNTDGKLMVRWKMFFQLWAIYVIPEGAIKTQVKLSLKRYKVLTQVK